MTISSTYTFSMTVAAVVRRAFQVAGLLSAEQTPEADDMNLGRDMLQLELDELQTAGDPQRNIERTTKALVASTASYTLDADAIDVLVAPDNLAGTIAVTGDSETHVYSMTRAEYQALSDKTTEGTPSRVFVEKADVITAYFWPVPSEAMTFSYSKLRLPRDATGSSTPDIDRRRLKALIWALAYDLATTKAGVPIDRIAMLGKERDRLKGLAKMDDVERGHAQLVVR